MRDNGRKNRSNYEKLNIRQGGENKKLRNMNGSHYPLAIVLQKKQEMWGAMWEAILNTPFIKQTTLITLKRARGGAVLCGSSVHLHTRTHRGKAHWERFILEASYLISKCNVSMLMYEGMKRKRTEKQNGLSCLCLKSQTEETKK